MAHARTTITAILLAVTAAGGTNTDTAITAALEPAAAETVEQQPRWVFDDELPGCDATGEHAVRRAGEADCPRRFE
jgi:hypothetical protein